MYNAVVSDINNNIDTQKKETEEEIITFTLIMVITSILGKQIFDMTFMALGTTATFWDNISLQLRVRCYMYIIMSSNAIINGNDSLLVNPMCAVEHHFSPYD